MTRYDYDTLLGLQYFNFEPIIIIDTATIPNGFCIKTFTDRLVKVQVSFRNTMTFINSMDAIDYDYIPTIESNGVQCIDGYDLDRAKTVWEQTLQNKGSVKRVYDTLEELAMDIHSSIETVEYLTKKDIIDKFDHLLSEEQKTKLINH